MANDKLIYASEARKAILNADPKLAYCIDSVPAVDAVEVVHGRWIESEGTVCSVCNKHFFTDGPWVVANYKANYCPNCGAKMDGQETTSSVISQRTVQALERMGQKVHGGKD